MDKKLKTYIKFAQKATGRRPAPCRPRVHDPSPSPPVGRSGDGACPADPVKSSAEAHIPSSPDFLDHHAKMLQIFQHERLIHLIVTMFFALFMIIFLIFTTILFFTLSPSLWGNILSYSSAIITLILVITTIFYVHHYYQLENGVQQLESILQQNTP